MTLAPTAALTSALPPRLRRVSPTRLHHLARELAARTDLWRPHVRFAHESRWSVRVAVTDDYEAWLLTWLPGQSHRPARPRRLGRRVHRAVRASSRSRPCRRRARRGPAALVHRTLDRRPGPGVRHPTTCTT